MAPQKSDEVLKIKHRGWSCPWVERWSSWGQEFVKWVKSRLFTSG